MTDQDKPSAENTLSMDVLNAVNDAFNSGNVDRILSHFHADCTWCMAEGEASEPDGRTLRGKSEIREVLEARRKTVPDMRWDRIYQYISGERAVTVWTVSGTRDGKKLNFQGCDLYDYKDGLIFKKDTYWKIIKQS